MRGRMVVVLLSPRRRWGSIRQIALDSGSKWRVLLSVIAAITGLAGPWPSYARVASAGTLSPSAKVDTIPPGPPIDSTQTVKVVVRRVGHSQASSSSQLIVPSQLVPNGAWSWFGDPRAVCAGPTTYVGWIDSQGNVVVGGFDRAAGLMKQATLHSRLQIDDHDNPSILLLADGRLLVFYSPHAGFPMYSRVSTRPGDVGAWEPARTVPADTRYTYPNPIRLAGEGNTIYLFWRGADFKPWFSTSTDGVSWSARRPLLQAGMVPYVKYVSNDRDRIHFAFTDDHPEYLATNNIYHAYYYKGRFYRADGTFLRDLAHLPLVASETDRIYDASSGLGRAWIWDIALDPAGNPVVVYSTMPSGADHRYRYARWNGASWDDHELVASGGPSRLLETTPITRAGSSSTTRIRPSSTCRGRARGAGTCAPRGVRRRGSPGRKTRGRMAAGRRPPDCLGRVAPDERHLRPSAPGRLSCSELEGPCGALVNARSRL